MKRTPVTKDGLAIPNEASLFSISWFPPFTPAKDQCVSVLASEQIPKVYPEIHTFYFLPESERHTFFNRWG